MKGEQKGKLKGQAKVRRELKVELGKIKNQKWRRAEEKPPSVRVQSQRITQLLWKGADQAVDEEELQDVQQHPAQRDLQGAQVRIGCEEWDESERAEDVSDGEQRLSDQRWMPHLPLFPGPRGVILEVTEGHMGNEVHGKDYYYMEEDFDCLEAEMKTRKTKVHWGDRGGVYLLIILSSHWPQEAALHQ